MTGDKAGLRRALAAATLCVALELGCALLMLADRPMSGLLLHVVACVILAAEALRGRKMLSPVTATVQTAALLLPFLGPVAAGACLVTVATIATLRDPASGASLWHEHLFPNLAADELTEQANAIGRRQTDPEGTDEIASFYDVLRWGTLAEQEHVLAMVSRSFRPEFAPVLRAGLAAADLSVRAQAAAGLSLLETRISGRLSHLEADFARQPAETKSGAAVSLATALADAAHSGLYDDARTREMRLEIVSLLTPLASAEDPALRVILGRTLIQLGELDRAVETLTSAATDGEGGQSAFTWLLEAVFRLGDVERIRALLARHPEQVQRLVRQDGPLAPALRFWAAA